MISELHGNYITFFTLSSVRIILFPTSPVSLTSNTLHSQRSSVLCYYVVVVVDDDDDDDDDSWHYTAVCHLGVTKYSFC
jgi:hypothetical protein